MRSTALAKIVVGVEVERRKARSPWLDFLRQPVRWRLGCYPRYPGRGSVRKATQPHYMRVRLRSNCIEPKQRTVGKISVRGCLRCGRSATDSCELWESCIRYPHRDGRSLGRRGVDRCRQRSGRDRPDACCDYRDDSFIAEHNVERPFTKRLRNRCESQIAGHHG